jgi:hypothetical protein
MKFKISVYDSSREHVIQVSLSLLQKLHLTVYGWVQLTKKFSIIQCPQCMRYYTKENREKGTPDNCPFCLDPLIKKE